MRLQHVGEADDAVERRAQLVAHGGQEVALEAVHLVELHVELGQLIDLAVELGVGLPQLRLRLDEVPQHVVERRGQVLELVVGVDFGPLVEVARGDGVAHVAQVLQRLDDHVADDHVQRDHRQEDGQDADRQQDRPVPGDLVLSG